MGKAISYCTTCQNQIREADFSKGTAIRLEERAYCATCSAEALKQVAPAKVAALLKDIASQARKSATSSTPARATQIVPPPPPPKAPPVALYGGIAAAAVVLVALIVAMSGSKDPVEKPAIVPEKKTAPVVDEAAVAYDRLVAATATSTDPEAILQRCQEARPKLRGSRYEPKLEEIERKAKDAWDAQLKESRFTAFLASVATMRKDDPGFERRAEVRALIQSTLATAGPRKPAVEQLLADYEKTYVDASRTAADQVKSRSFELSSQNRWRAAASALEDYPAAFADTDAGRSIASIKRDYEAKAAEQAKAEAAAVKAEQDRRKAVWSAWTFLPEPETPVFVLERHHVRRMPTPSSITRALEIPAGKGAVLSLQTGREDGKSGWLLRVSAENKELARVPVGPDGRIWKTVFVDLSPLAGKKADLKLDLSGPEAAFLLEMDVKVLPDAAAASALIVREQDPFAAWTISCSPNSQALPTLLPEYRGRKQVMQTHPFSKEKPGVMEREVALPAKKKATLVFWTSFAEGADWELRVLADGTELKKQLIGGDTAWTRHAIDLSAYAGKTVKLSLQNWANDWSSEFGYWSEVGIVSQD